jgi:hypothetical protein
MDSHVTCPVCGGGPGPGETRHWHEDERHRFEYERGTGLTSVKPPYRITDFIKAGTITADTIKPGMIEASPRFPTVHEENLRKRRREIADARSVRGEWHEGTCSGCGLADLPVIGLPGSEFCQYCEELRVLKPPDFPVTTAPAAPVRVPMHPNRLTASLVLAVIGIVLVFSDVWWAIPAVLLATSYLLAKTA